MREGLVKIRWVALWFRRCWRRRRGLVATRRSHLETSEQVVDQN